MQPPSNLLKLIVNGHFSFQNLTATSLNISLFDVIASANLVIDKKQNVLGLIASVEGENRFYFAGSSVGGGITSSDGQQMKISREYLVSNLVDTLDFKQIMANAGATVVSEKPEEGEFIDLSPEAIDKTTIINLIQNA